MPPRTVLLNPGPVPAPPRRPARPRLRHLRGAGGAGEPDLPLANMGDVTLDEYREFLGALAAVLAGAR
jgi:hypothetical protein